MRKSAGVLAEKGLLRVRGGPFYADRLQFCQLCAFISQTLVHLKINTQPFDLSIFLTAHIKNTQRSPLRRRFLTRTLEKAFCAIGLMY